MKRIYSLAIGLSAFVLFLFTQTPLLAAASTTWNVQVDIERLNREAPALEAFDEAPAVIWQNLLHYDLLADGTMRKRHRMLIMLGEPKDAGGYPSYTIPYPLADNAKLHIDRAEYYNPKTAEKLGDLPIEHVNQDGVECAVVRFPEQAKGSVLAIATTATDPMRYYLDEVLTLARELPIWEQEVAVEIPEGMDLYWEGIGVRSPQRSKTNGTERIVWTVLNQPAWRQTGIVNERRPALLFSLQRGLLAHLKTLAKEEDQFKAPAVPKNLAVSQGNLAKTGNAIVELLREKTLSVEGYLPPEIRDNRSVSMDGPWTRWEQTLIMGKWLRELGWETTVFWTQKIPVGASAPGARGLWDYPLLKIGTPGGKDDIFFHFGQMADFGKLDQSLYGASVYRSGGTEIERLVLPKGNASEHQLSQMWRLTIDETGLAEGTLEISVTGGWVDALSLGRTPSAEKLEERLLQKMHFPVQGLVLSDPVVKLLSSGYRMTFRVKATVGIASGGDVLLRTPGGLPACMGEIPEDETAVYAFKFPFILEQNALITTPQKYRAIMLPHKTQTGDQKALYEDAVLHWPKKRHAELSSKWTVRSTGVDELLARKILEQLSLAGRWSTATIPLRK